MIATRRSPWLAVAVFVAMAYLVTGLVFGELAGSSGSHQATIAWRWAAWAISGAAFAAHILFEQRQLGSSVLSTALRASLAAGLGAFGLAVAASLHARTTHQHFPALALAIFPIGTVVPAFLVAFAVAAVLARRRRGA